MDKKDQERRTFCFSITAGADAFLLAIENVAGSVISAGGLASAYAFGDAADVTVDGDGGALLFAYNDLLGTVRSGAGPAEAFAGGDGWVLEITADTDAAVTALGDLQAFNTTAANGDANLFAGGHLEAVVNAGDGVYSASYGDSDLDVTAGGDAQIFSLGLMTADVTAGNDVWAAAWDDMDLDVAAGHDIPLVWTFGDLTGTIDAANRIGDDDTRFGRIKSYG
ncbi:hypothetical protein LCGC14_2399940, partial [marine sediment metagenome]